MTPDSFSLLFGLAVGEKAAPLIEMKQCAADMMRRQGPVQRLGAQLIGIEFFQFLARRFVRRHQAVRDQQVISFLRRFR